MQQIQEYNLEIYLRWHVRIGVTHERLFVSFYSSKWVTGINREDDGRGITIGLLFTKGTSVAAYNGCAKLKSQGKNLSIQYIMKPALQDITSCS